MTAATTPLSLDCIPADHPLAGALLDLATAAAGRLELADHLGGVTLCLDDLSPDERAWFSFRRSRPADGAPGSRLMTLYLHPSQLLADRLNRPGLLPEPGSWEGLDARAAEEEVDVGAFSRRKIERFLHHQFLFARDLCAGRIDPEDLPDRWAASFQEAWAVTVDGRLKEARWPGYSVAERRRRFSRAFCRSGVLVPEHWRIFHELWEGGEVPQGRVLEMLRRLPSVHSS